MDPFMVPIEFQLQVEIQLDYLEEVWSNQDKDNSQSKWFIKKDKEPMESKK
jgi:hypothetical protein